MPQTYDLAHVQAIHAHLFQDVYEWAGQLRVVELVRPSENPDAPGHQFMPPAGIETAAQRLFEHLGDPHALAAQPVGDRVERLAQTYAGINLIHPFVEGNGRTQRLFLQDVAGAAGCAIDWTQMPQQNQVMAEAFTAGYEPVRDALTPCVSDLNATTHTETSEAARDAMRAQRRAFPDLGRPDPSSTNQTPGGQPPGGRRGYIRPTRDRGEDYGR